MKKLIIIVLILAANCFALELVRQKNAATYITFPLIDSTTTTALQSGATAPDSEIDTWADGAAPDGFADCANEAQEIGTSGIYYLSLTNTEMNADYVIIQIKASDALTQVIIIRTMVGDPLLVASTDDGGAINVTGGAVDAVTTTGTATTVTNGVTVTTNNDKTGYSLSVTPPTAQNIWEYATRDITSISGSSTTADNLEVVYATDFATNYNTTLDMWSVNLVKWLTVEPLALTSQKVQADASVSLSSENISDIADAVAAAVVLTGDGSVSVGWNYDGMTAYATSGGVAINNATVKAYLKSDYDAYNRSAVYVKGETTTDVNGKFEDNLMLDPATYTIVWYKQGEYGPNTDEITVTAP